MRPEQTKGSALTRLDQCFLGGLVSVPCANRRGGGAVNDHGGYGDYTYDS